jgi:hypothetical protein
MGLPIKSSVVVAIRLFNTAVVIFERLERQKLDY